MCLVPPFMLKCTSDVVKSFTHRHTDAHMSIPCMYLTTLTLRPCLEMVVSTSPALLLQGKLWGGHQEVMALNSSWRSSFWASSSAGDTNVQSFTRICKRREQKLYCCRKHCPHRGRDRNCWRYIFICILHFVPVQRLFAGVPSGQQEQALAGSEPDLGSSPGWVLEVVVAEVAEMWGLLVPQSCEAGRRTGRDIWPAWTVRTWWSCSPRFSDK